MEPYPFKSSLTRASAAQVAEEYQAATDKQWTQPIGFVHALFEVAAAALKASANVDDKQALATAIKGVNLDTVVGKVSWSGGRSPTWPRPPGRRPVAQERRQVPVELVIVSNKDHPEIPKAGSLEPPYGTLAIPQAVIAVGELATRRVPWPG